MNQRGCRNQSIAFGPGIGNVKPRTSLRHDGVNREDAILEPGKDLMVDPSTQQGALCRVPACNRQCAKLNFEN